MNLEQLRTILGAWQQAELDGRVRESWQSAGSTYLRERLQLVAERCCRDWPGDLIEIGCLNGSTTVLLAQVARIYSRRLVAIDPWETGTQNCEGGEYERFMAAIEPFKELVDVMRQDSRNPGVISVVRSRSLAFAFVDGLHEYEAASSDIAMCGHAQLIVVDDITWSKDVHRAFEERLPTREHVELAALHEGYIL